jgi:hypothetical protein
MEPLTDEAMLFLNDALLLFGQGPPVLGFGFPFVSTRLLSNDKSRHLLPKLSNALFCIHRWDPHLAKERHQYDQ